MTLSARSERSDRGDRGDRGAAAFDLCELQLAGDDAAAARVHRVGRRAYAVEAELIGFDGIPALQESIEEMRDQPLRWLGAVGDGGRLAAFVAWQNPAGDHGGNIVDIDRVCVDPDWFRCGLASRLIRHLLVHLAPAGNVQVSTGADNGPAVALYESLGFSRVGTIEPVPGLRLAQFLLDRSRSGRSGS
ncbi:GNAT family N-acetyltransferase [Streptomyces sp. NPDC048361]|uniref:GNAT family N-acetyltransferase n=1 Tax=Streptomyces sp. NPDC048361 TaxID=3154720 RepID=UPI00342B7C21